MPYSTLTADPEYQAPAEFLSAVAEQVAVFESEFESGWAAAETEWLQPVAA
jgi:hypothetical protein